ncbi:hypothetical protein [Bartonella sp. LJL80]
MSTNITAIMKLLEWVDTKTRAGATVEIAVTQFASSYTIVRVDEKYVARLEDIKIGVFKSLCLAKSACQKDYECRLAQGCEPEIFWKFKLIAECPRQAGTVYMLLSPQYEPMLVKPKGNSVWSMMPLGQETSADGYTHYAEIPACEVRS